MLHALIARAHNIETINKILYFYMQYWITREAEETQVQHIRKSRYPFTILNGRILYLRKAYGKIKAL
jgi:hypothetical protein